MYLFQHRRIFRLAFFWLWKIIQGENDCNHRFLCITELKENWKTTETRRRQYDRFRKRLGGRIKKYKKWRMSWKFFWCSRKNCLLRKFHDFFYSHLFSQILLYNFFRRYRMKFNWDGILNFFYILSVYVLSEIKCCKVFACGRFIWH